MRRVSFNTVATTPATTTRTLVVTVNDGNGGTKSSPTRSLTVNPLPVPANDPYSMNEDGVLTVSAAAGLLANDSDVDGESMIVSKVNNSALNVGNSVRLTHGSVTVQQDGSFVYTPDADFNGTESFTYRVKDALENQTSATVTITVNPVNDAPVASNASFSTNEDTAKTGNRPASFQAEFENVSEIEVSR
jgi:VCBS repeat-containing protein